SFPTRRSSDLRAPEALAAGRPRARPSQGSPGRPRDAGGGRRARGARGDGRGGGARRSARRSRVLVPAQGPPDPQAGAFLPLPLFGRQHRRPRRGDPRSALDATGRSGREADLFRGARDGGSRSIQAAGGPVGSGPVQVLNFYSAVFSDQLRKGRKTATIRLGDKSHKYRKNQVVLVTIGYQHSPREKIFEAVIDQVEVKRVKDLSPRDIEHDNPEFRRTEEKIHFLEQIYGRKVEVDDTVTVVRFSQIVDSPSELTDRLRGIGGAQN